MASSNTDGKTRAARAVLVVVCAAVLISIAGLIARQWATDTVAGRTAKIVILMAWLWASTRMVKRALK